MLPRRRPRRQNRRVHHSPWPPPEQPTTQHTLHHTPPEQARPPHASTPRPGYPAPPPRRRSTLAAQATGSSRDARTPDHSRLHQSTTSRPTPAASLAGTRSPPENQQGASSERPSWHHRRWARWDCAPTAEESRGAVPTRGGRGPMAQIQSSQTPLRSNHRASARGGPAAERDAAPRAARAGHLPPAGRTPPAPRAP